ncbi:ABC transporter substrate-binding protein [Muricoccus radiodurans]|uniref:ABC transporter substrate-binding protein n=1 Tax=Muricoccus radiodurans TaxID=2231721 RepID=UPI003CE6EED6
MQRRSLLRGAASATVALAAPRIGLAQAGRVLRVAPHADLSILDPVWTLAYITRNHGFMVFDTLYGLDAEFQPQPQMVAGHAVEEDGRLWRLTLRDGLIFHDGTPVLARDCVASIRRWWSADAFGQTLAAATDELSAPSDKEIRFGLKRPFALLPTALAKASPYMCAIMPERLAVTPQTTQVSEMIGSGPFRFLANERVPGAFSAWQRFDRYVPAPGANSFLAGGKRVHFDRVEWKILPEPGTAAAALQSGEIDWWEQPSPDMLPLLRRNRNVVIETIDPSGSIGVFRFNHQHAPFNNPAIRRAVLDAVDQTPFMQAVAGEDPSLWQDRVGFFTPGTPMASNAGMENLFGPRDLERSKRELAAAGYRGERVVLLAATNIEAINVMASVVGDLLKRLGMNVDYVATDWGTVMQRRTSQQPTERGGWSAFVGTWSGYDLASPAVSISLRGNGGAAGGWLESPEIERLRSAWFEAPDLAAQQRLCRELQVQAWHDVPFIPLGQWRTQTARRREITDLPRGVPAFWGVRPA